jgi:hypothetical protein
MHVCITPPGLLFGEKIWRIRQQQDLQGQRRTNHEHAPQKSRIFVSLISSAALFRKTTENKELADETWRLYPHMRLRTAIFAQIWETLPASHRRRSASARVHHRPRAPPGPWCFPDALSVRPRPTTDPHAPRPATGPLHHARPPVLL